jgi:AraC family transcriptional regulator
LAKIAIELDQALASRAAHDAPGRAHHRILAQGPGWSVSDVMCTSGPRDRPFEERHSGFAIAIVVAGTFQYRASTPRAHTASELMTPGSLLLGSAGQCFECGHEHASGDRCLSFHYSSDYLERIAADAGHRSPKFYFPVLRLPPLRGLTSLISRASAGLAGCTPAPWEELSIQLAARTIQLASGLSPGANSTPPSALARITRSVRMIERHSNRELGINSLAREARLSPYHFLRTFGIVTGLTPHQYIRRARLREAAMRLASGQPKVLDVALDSGFGDVSNFNHAFRSEFGLSPRAFRLQSLPTPSG